jgi:hypothetical protein
MERPSPMTREKTPKPRRISALRSRRRGKPALFAALVADGETFAALGATPCKDFSAILRRHSLAEPVGVAPLAPVRLIRALHKLWLLVTNKPRNIWKNGAEFKPIRSICAWIRRFDESFYYSTVLSCA